MLSGVLSLLYGGNVWRQLTWDTDFGFEGCCYSEKGFEKVLFDYLYNFWIAALQKHQASLTFAVSSCHFASSDVDQSSNSGSCKYYFSWLQNCWTGRPLFSLVWPSHSGIGGNRVWTYSAASVAGSFLPWWEQRVTALAPSVSEWQEDRGGWHRLGDSTSGRASRWEGQRWPGGFLSGCKLLRCQGSSFWRRGQEPVIAQPLAEDIARVV